MHLAKATAFPPPFTVGLNSTTQRQTKQHARHASEAERAARRCARAKSLGTATGTWRGIRL